MKRSDFFKTLLAIPAAAVVVKEIEPVDFQCAGHGEYMEHDDVLNYECHVRGTAVIFNSPNSVGDIYAPGCFDVQYLPKPKTFPMWCPVDARRIKDVDLLAYGASLEVQKMLDNQD